MPAIIISMLVIVGLALFSLAVVAIGMRGKFSEAAPTVADRLAVVGHHLNGEADMPTKLQAVYERVDSSLSKVGQRK